MRRRGTRHRAFALARFLPGGGLDPTFGEPSIGDPNVRTGKVITGFPKPARGFSLDEVRSLLLTPRHLIAAGSANFFVGLARYQMVDVVPSPRARRC